MIIGTHIPWVLTATLVKAPIQTYGACRHPVSIGLHWAPYLPWPLVTQGWKNVSTTSDFLFPSCHNSNFLYLLKNFSWGLHVLIVFTRTRKVKNTSFMMMFQSSVGFFTFRYVQERVWVVRYLLWSVAIALGRLSIVFFVVHTLTLLPDEVYKSCVHLAGWASRRTESGVSNLQEWKSGRLSQHIPEEVFRGHGRLTL